MEKIEFISSVMTMYMGKDPKQKREYKKNLSTFVYKCRDDKLQEVYNHALTLRFKNADTLMEFAKKNNCLIGDTPLRVKWTCDHGGVGLPVEVNGSHCSACGDRRQEPESK